MTTRYDAARLPAALLLALLLVQPAVAQTGDGSVDGSTSNGRTTLPVVVAPTGPLPDDASAPDPASGSESEAEPESDISETAADAVTEPDRAPEPVSEAGPTPETASDADIDSGSELAPEPEPTPVPEPADRPAADPAMLRPGSASTFDGSPADAMVLPASCADMADPSFPGAFTEPTPLPEGAPGLVVYSRDDDLIRLLETDEAVRVEASAGDDTVYAIGVGDRVEIAGGGGGDTIVVCAMAGAELHILMGRGVVPMDRFPDAVVIDFGVFARSSGARQIWIEGFLSVNDRLELRVPPNLEVETVRTVRGVPEEFRVGDMTLYLNAGGTVPAAPDGFDPASIVIVAGEAP